MELQRTTFMRMRAEIEFVLLLNDAEQVGDAMSEIIFDAEFPDMSAVVQQITLTDWEVVEERQAKLKLER